MIQLVRFQLKWILLAAGVILSSLSCRADMYISFTNDATATSFVVFEGSTIEIPLFLVASSGDNRLASLGVYSSGATVEFGYGSGAGSLNSGNATIEAVALESHWDSSLNYLEIDNLQKYAILEGLVSGPSVTPVFPTSGSNFVKIGRVTLHSGVVGNVTQLSLSDSRNFENINLLYDSNLGVSLQGQITFVNATLATIQAVPEPSSLLTVGLAISLLAGLRFRCCFLASSEVERHRP